MTHFLNHGTFGGCASSPLVPTLGRSGRGVQEANACRRYAAHDLRALRHAHGPRRRYQRGTCTARPSTPIRARSRDRSPTSARCVAARTGLAPSSPPGSPPLATITSRSPSLSQSPTSMFSLRHVPNCGDCVKLRPGCRSVSCAAAGSERVRSAQHAAGTRNLPDHAIAAPPGTSPRSLPCPLAAVPMGIEPTCIFTIHARHCPMGRVVTGATGWSALEGRRPNKPPHTTALARFGVARVPAGVRTGAPRQLP